MKKAVRFILFITILVVCVLFAQTKLCYDDELKTQHFIKDYYELDGNTVDVICTGTSAVQRGWLVPTVYEKYGIASYSLASASQPFCLTKNIMKEALKTQQPKLFLIDIRSAIETPSELEEAKVRRVTDNMKESLNRIDAINTLREFASHGKNDIDTGDISLYVKIARYHTLADPNNRPEDKGVEYFGGFAYYEPSNFNIVPMQYVGIVNDRAPINKYAEAALNDLLDYCDSIDAEVLFTLIPYAGEEEEIAKVNTAIDIVKARGYECLNFLQEPLRSEIGVDFDKFFYNERHTNLYGSNQYINYIAAYIQDKYVIPDHRGDDRYNLWQNYADCFNKETKSKMKAMYRELGIEQ